MPQTFLIFDFGSDEEAAQKARHGVENWRQGFRLGQKLTLKFDRQEAADGAAAAATKAAAASKGGSASNAKGAEGGEKEPADASGESKPAHIVLLVRLDFSDHEKLSYQRWLDRIPGEAAFKDAKAKVIHQGDADFKTTAEKFGELS